MFEIQRLLYYNICGLNHEPSPTQVSSGDYNITMALKSGIEWTEATWNPSTGCTKVSAACKHCYAERLALRLQKMGVKKYRNGFKLTMHYEELEKPLHWKTPSIIFVNSMSDLFHEELSLDFIKQVFHVMNKAHWHIFQVLTKRSKRLKELAHELTWTDNIWIGVTVESPKYFFRIEDLMTVEQASVRFLSLEPLLASMKGLEEFLKTGLIDWVIVGGESGPKARPMKKAWVIEIRDMCREYNVPFFFKQWGGINKKKSGRLLDGRTYDEMPIKRQKQPSLAFV